MPRSPGTDLQFDHGARTVTSLDGLWRFHTGDNPAWANPDFKTFANAGHLPPYLDGKELTVADGLPLGIAEENTYTDMTWELDPGDRLTFVSDGVVEARKPSGEPYGFARTKSISNQPAETIARTAQSFGQEDDITVLTIQRVPARQTVTA